VVIVLPEDAPLIMAYACSCLSLCSISKLYRAPATRGAKTPPAQITACRFNGEYGYIVYDGPVENNA
jgi:hypothetical protein